MYSKIAFRGGIAIFIGLALLLGEIAPVGAGRVFTSDGPYLESRLMGRSGVAKLGANALGSNRPGNASTVRSYSSPLPMSSSCFLSVPRSTMSGDDKWNCNCEELLKTANKLSNLFSKFGGTVGAINTALQLILMEDPNQQLKNHFDRIASAITVHFDRKFYEDHLGTVLSAVEDVRIARDMGRKVDIGSYSDVSSRASVLAEVNSASTRIFSEEATSGYWNRFISQPPHTDEVYDWRIGVPSLMQLIALRLVVIAAIDPNFRSDNYFDNELLEYYRQALLGHYKKMAEGVQCGHNVKAVRHNSRSVNVACADVYTGLEATAWVDVQGHPGCGTRTIFEEPDPREVRPCVSLWEREALRKYYEAKEKAMVEKETTLKLEVLHQMPFFEMRSMIDTLYLYASGEPDLTEVLNSIPFEAAKHLCLDVQGDNPVAGTLVWLRQCNGSDAQKWVYDRENSTVYNPVYKKYLDVQYSNPTPGAPVWIWDYNGTDAQRWTYDPEKHVLQNALGTVLGIPSFVVGWPINTEWYFPLPKTPVLTKARNESLAQRWYNGVRPVIVTNILGAEIGSLYSGEYINQPLPAEASSSLKELGVSLQPGSYSFEPVPPDQYEVAEGKTKGLPLGLLLNQSNGTLSGAVQAEAGKQFEAHFFAVNGQGEKVAQMQVTIRVAGASDSVSSLAGSIDAINCEAINGRAWDRSQQQRVISVDIYDGNTLLATIPANQLWKDPLPVDPGSGNQQPGRGNNYHGFSYLIPDSLKDARPHVILVRFAGTGTSLAGSPKTISINPAPVITDQPDDLSVCTGKPATFSVTATGADLHYQWYKDKAPIAGATGRSLTIAAVGAGDYGAYHVVISTGCSSATSRSATLNVNDAIAITSQPVSTGSCAGKPVTFSVGATGTNLRYQWRKDGGNISGATDSSYTIPSLSMNDAGSYSVVVYNGCSTVISGNAVLTVNNAIAITSQPASVTKCAGQPATFSVTATGSNLRYQWRKNGGNISGATGSSFTINSVSPGDAASYYVVVYNGCSTVNSATVSLTVNPPLTLSTTSQSFGPAGGSGSVNVIGSGCGWTAASNVSWIKVTNGASGVGAGTVSYSVEANAGAARIGTITIGGQTFTVTQASGSGNPTPALTSLSPNSVAAGSPSLTITVNGAGFISGSTVRRNGIDRFTTYISPTQLRVTLPGSDFATPGTASISVFTPTPGGGISNALSFSVTCSYSISPTSQSFGAGAESRRVDVTTFSGCGWTASSNVGWITISSGASGSGNGAVNYSVMANPSASARTGTLTIAGKTFTVNQAAGSSNPAPAIASLDPNTVFTGSSGFTLTVNGTGFIPSSIARWNGSDRPTTFISSTQLRIALPATDRSLPGTASVTVSNPGPGGGISNSQTVTINRCTFTVCP